ncbi:T9SS type A sorting domain-containing protein [Flavobacteriaceae bacterium S356]|uniref:T9SS type A sorting domain-containing protein n=1 Tax=Asprobacillus argus TaxID=3076534 RepID=A0ABU3LCW2_9FLAO|nr:T9SS type A sorting domain-containing protein [Flavobacteriaceae bacterium S356]
MGDINFNFHLFGETGKITTYKKLYTIFFAILCFAISNTELYAQTIPSTGSESTTCGNCTPTGWTDNGGTPDISNRDSAGGQGSVGGGATWVSQLPIPPTGDITWITMKDLGSSGIAEESVTTTMGGLVSGKVYVLTLYTLSAISNADGGGGGTDYYSGEAKTQFDYQIGSNPKQTSTSIATGTWTKTKFYFIGDPNGSGEMSLIVFPGTYASYDGTGSNLTVSSLNFAVELNALEELDTDGDGVPDTDDIDDDNDGILDTVETTLSGTEYDPLGDEDGDKLPNFLDTNDNNGTSDGSTTSYVDANSDGVPDVYDFDNDGIPNHLDLDSDNDGIPDNIEAQTTAGYIGLAADNAATYTANNGLNSAYVGQAFISAPTNTDGTGEADYRDLNSDDDATDDTTEANLILSGTVGENGLDNSYDNGDTYADVNGIFDNTQTDNFPDTGPGPDVNWRDSGIDGTLDTDGDGVPNSTDVDDDNDGIPDSVEGTGDTDGDGVPNYLDLDSDGDGIPDIIEAQTTAGYVAPDAAGTIDTDGDGLNDAFDPDCTGANCEGVTGVDLSSPLNTNSGSDSVPDYLDTDSDGDGTLDRIEANLSLSGNAGVNGLDSNYDNGDDYTDVNGSFDDTQSDNFPDTIVGGDVDWRDAATAFADNDNDGIVDSVDLDDDNDGILDNQELCNNSATTSNTSTINVYIDLGGFENENTWTLTGPSGFSESGGPYADGDDIIDLNYNVTTSGTYVFTLFDSANDGLDTAGGSNENGGSFYRISLDGSTVFESGQFPDFGDGSTEAAAVVNTVVTLPRSAPFLCLTADPSADSDGDGIVNYADPDYATANGTTIVNGVCASLDTDGDGIIDSFDLDSDNDGIPDNIEAQSTGGYAVPDGVYDSNGVDTAYTGGLTPEDTDSDGTDDYKDTDTDNDGILDNTEAGLILTGIYGNNGLDNAYDNGDNYVDVNGSFDNSQTDNFPDADGDVFNSGDVDYRDDTFTVDTDGDGVNDEVDLDDDNDGIVDSIEIGSCTPGAANFVWGTQFSTNDDPTTSPGNSFTIDNVGITITRTSNVTSSSTFGVSNGTGDGTFYSLLQLATENGRSRHIFNFDAPVYGLGFTLYDLDVDTGTATDNVQVIITKQDGTTYTMVAGVDYTVPAGITDLTNNTFQGNNGNDGSDLTISSIPEWITQIQIVYENSGTGSLTGTQIMAIGDFAFCTPLDSDSDGVFDFRDLDADNDGIPDNIEAQSTQNYVAPTGNFSLSGIDLAYDTGLTPINTDEMAVVGADAIADYLDTDSDGDGTNDVLEALDTPLANDGTRVTGTVGTNGLIDDVETGDTDQGYTDINGEYVDPETDGLFSDTDADVSIGGDLQYRDTVVGVDTDGDGIANTVDIDDDGDGIPDEVELMCNTITPPTPTLDDFNSVAGGSVDETECVDGILTFNNGARLNRPDEFVRVDFGSELPTGTVIFVYLAVNNINNKSVNIYQTDTDGSTQVNLVTQTDTQINAAAGGNNLVTIYNYTLSAPTQFFEVYMTSRGGGRIEVNEIVPQSYTNPACNLSLDSDSDGIIDSLDIDADGDGIPDNIEAQTTLGYVAPTTADTDGDGLADVYDPDCTGANCSGITGVDLSIPNDDDGDTTPDYLDTDSDEDGTPDIQENGDSDNVASGTDSDGDGLDDNFEGSDVNDGYDVNDEINTPSTDLPDADSDVNAGVDGNSDVDFRDAVTGTVTPGATGNILWLRADIDISETTNEVTSWTDQTSTPFNASNSGVTGPDLIPGTDASALNFNPVLRFENSNESLVITNGILGTGTASDNVWVYGVSMSNSATANNYIVDQNGAGADVISLQAPNGGSSQVAFQSGNGTILTNTWGGTTGVFSIWNGFNSTTAGSTPTTTNKGVYRDGLLLNTNNSGDSFTSDNSDLTIGTDGASFFNGDIAEIMVFTSIPSDLEQQNIQSYLAVKYGITLNSTDTDGDIVEGDYILNDLSTKVWDYTANTTGTDFHNDVAGIGRDDALALAQYQSKSINSDAIITMGLTEIATSNATNSNFPVSEPYGTGFSSNKDFLMWGNNDGSVLVGGVSVDVLVCAPETTLARTWKVVETGTMGTVEVGVVQSTIDAALVTANTIKVFKVADDESFTTNVEYIPLTTTQDINGVTNYVFNYDFNGTKYFTFSEINGIFWNGDSASWTGGNSSGVTGGPSTNSEDRDKVLVIDSETSLTNAILAESVEVECVWVKENSKLVIPSDYYLEFDEDFILDGEIRLVGDAQLVQTHTGLSNVQGTGKIYKDQQALVPNVYRYHYWSSPVRETGLNSFRVGQVMYDGNQATAENSTLTAITWNSSGFDGAPGTAGVTPITIANYWIYSNLNDPGDGSAWVQQTETGVLQRGQGYSMKSTGVVGQNYTFYGTPNDGSLVFNFTGAGETSLLGNPYPSALDITDFINTNINSIDGTLYFWEHTGEDSDSTTIEGHTQAGYQGGYSQRNISMGVAANGVAAIESETYDWENATQNAASVTQVVTEAASSTEVTVTYTVSSGVANLNTSYGDANGTSGNVLNNSTGLSEYVATFTFSEDVDLSSIYIVNDNPSAGNVLFKLNPNNASSTNNSEVEVTLNNDTGNTVNLNWNDVASFTIAGPSGIDINLVIDNILWSIGGEISLGQGTYHAPSRYMAVAQGFFVSSSATGGDVRFENSMRNYRSSTAPSEPTFFFRNGDRQEQEEEDLLPVLKLGMGYENENAYDLHRQIGISFRASNSFGFENGYDSEIFDVGNIDMYWEFDEIPDKKFIIAGVQPISDNLEVPLSIELDSDEPVYIMIDEIINIDVPVYLLDKITGVYHDLKDPIELQIPNGSYKDRFYITFGSTLSVDDNNVLNTDLNLFVDQNTDEIVIKNFTNLNIEKVELYDILGQKIKTWKSLDSSPENRLKTTSLSAGVYIVNVTSEKGKSSKKIVFD